LLKVNLAREKQRSLKKATLLGREHLFGRSTQEGRKRLDREKGTKKSAREYKQ